VKVETPPAELKPEIAICILDAVLEVRPPFDPEQAMAQCAVLLKRYGVATVTGDRYAGEWPVARFREHGIEFVQSARPKSDLCYDLLPLLGARRVELLDHPRLVAQLAGLERRAARSGKDSIDHSLEVMTTSPTPAPAFWSASISTAGRRSSGWRT
jgi:hypothetical protein